MFNGDRLMIIELGKYYSAEELLIETRTTGSQGYICYQNGDWRVSVTGAAVLMEEEGTGMQTGTGVHTIGLQVGNENRHPYDHCRAIKEALACNKIEID